MIKVAYISSPKLSDVDISLLKELAKCCEVYYYILASPYDRQGAAVDIDKLPSTGLYKGNVIKNLQKFENILPLGHMTVVYNKGRMFYPSAFHVVHLLCKELEKVDVVHLTWPLKYSQFELFRFKNKMVLTVHDPIPHSTQTSKILHLERYVSFSNINKLILLNDRQKKEFEERYDINKKHVFKSKLGCYEYLKDLEGNYQQSKEYILFFGQISVYKGVEYLLEAMVNVHDINPDIKLIVAGSGKYYFDKDAYERLPYIEIINKFIPDSELASMIKQSLFVVVPYVDATQSGVVMSAYAFDKPCIVTNVGALPEMVENMKNGLVVPSKDSHALARAIVYLLNNRVLLHDFSDAIRKKYRTGEYSWREISKKILQIYKK